MISGGVSFLLPREKRFRSEDLWRISGTCWISGAGRWISGGGEGGACTGAVGGLGEGNGDGTGVYVCGLSVNSISSCSSSSVEYRLSSGSGVRSRSVTN